MGIPWGIPEIHWFCLKQLILSILSTFQLLKIWKIKFCCKPLWICEKLVSTTWLSPLLSKTMLWNNLMHNWDTVILLKTAYFKHFEHFPAIEKFKKINFTANHGEYLWNWSQKYDFYQCWAKNCMGIPWVIPEIHWFWLKQFLLSILSTFHLLKIWKIKFCCKPLSICVKLVKTTWRSPVLSKKLHGTTLSHTCDTLILLKTAYFKHFAHFPATENLKN